MSNREVENALRRLPITAAAELLREGRPSAMRLDKDVPPRRSSQPKRDGRSDPRA